MPRKRRRVRSPEDCIGKTPIESIKDAFEYSRIVFANYENGIYKQDTDPYIFMFEESKNPMDLGLLNKLVLEPDELYMHSYFILECTLNRTYSARPKPRPQLGTDITNEQLELVNCHHEDLLQDMYDPHFLDVILYSPGASCFWSCRSGQISEMKPTDDEKMPDPWFLPLPSDWLRLHAYGGKPSAHSFVKLLHQVFKLVYISQKNQAYDKKFPYQIIRTEHVHDFAWTTVLSMTQIHSKERWYLLLQL